MFMKSMKWNLERIQVLMFEDLKAIFYWKSHVLLVFYEMYERTRKAWDLAFKH